MNTLLLPLGQAGLVLSFIIRSPVMKALESPTTTRESLEYGSRHSTETGETKILSVDLKDVLIEQGEIKGLWT